MYKLTNKDRILMQYDMNKLTKNVPVKWDRFVISDHFVSVYGWIPNKNPHHEDFILVKFDIEELEFSDCYMEWATSSQKYSAKISRNMNVDHNRCQRWVRLRTNQKVIIDG